VTAEWRVVKPFQVRFSIWLTKAGPVGAAHRLPAHQVQQRPVEQIGVSQYVFVGDLAHGVDKLVAQDARQAGIAFEAVLGEERKHVVTNGGLQGLLIADRPPVTHEVRVSYLKLARIPRQMRPDAPIDLLEKCGE
jgi:hypothetical protein